MITDGYTETGVFGDTVLEYRPMLHAERVAVLRRASLMTSEEERSRAIWQNLMWRVVFASPPRHEWAASLDIIKAMMGIGKTLQEREDADNLYEGAKLYFQHPRLMNVSCDDCRKWEFYPMTGLYQMSRTGNRVERDPDDKVLCDTTIGCPKGHYTAPKMLSEKNKRALRFDLECRAVSHWPNDQIVSRNARVIGAAQKGVPWTTS